MAKGLLLKKLTKLINNRQTDQEYKRRIQLVSRIKIEDITADHINMKNFLRKYEQFHADKFGKLDC